MRFPLWISSMTGGTKQALQINQRLAQAAGTFGLGMGLGSCRALLEKNNKASLVKQFALRPLIGKEAPFFANLGLAQIATILQSKQMSQLNDLLNMLDVDGLIIHMNPLQEWIQPEGDRYLWNPHELLVEFLHHPQCPKKIIVKEVGQGMGPKSLKALMKLPLAAIDFGAYGGTNFSLVEEMRGPRSKHSQIIRNPWISVGHTAEEMITFIRELISSSSLKEKHTYLVQEFVISGGVKSFLDGQYLMNRLGFRCVFGQGSQLLGPAMDSYEELQAHIKGFLLDLLLARNILTIK
jgi:isopentenyl-diphosphate delta-isomerase